MDFLTEFDEILSNPSFQVHVVGIDGAPQSKVTGILCDEISVPGGNSFSNMLQSSALERINEALQKLQSFTERLGFFEAMRANGLSLRTLDQSLDFWVSSEKPKFQIKLIFPTIHDTDDCRIPISWLYKTVYPTFTGFGLSALVNSPLGFVPYSTTDPANNVRGTIGIQVGKWFSALGQVMDSVQFQFSKETVADGSRPLYAVGSISFHPFREISWQEACAYLGVHHAQ